MHNYGNSIVRRSERLALSVPVTISGTDADGVVFKEKSRTLIVSKHGGLIAVSHKLRKGGQIQIENPALGRMATAKVIWVGDGRFSEASYEAGVEVAGAEYLWPVEFGEATRSASSAKGSNGDKPEKHDEIAPERNAEPEEMTVLPPVMPDVRPGVAAFAGSSAPRLATAAMEPSPPPAVMAAAISQPIGRAAAIQRESKVLDFPTPQPRGFAEVQGTAALAQASLPSQRTASDPHEALAVMVEQAEETMTKQFKLFDEKLAVLTEQVFSRTQIKLQEMENHLEEKITTSINQHCRALGENLKAFRTQAQTIIARFDEMKQTGESGREQMEKDVREAGEQALRSVTEGLEKKLRSAQEAAAADIVEQTRQRIQEEASQQVLRSVTEDVEKKLRSAQEAASSDFVEQTRKRIQEEASASVEIFSKEAAAALAIRQAQVMEQAKGQITEAARAATAEFAQKLKSSAADSLTEFCLKIETQNREKQSAELSAFAGRLQETAHGLQDRTVREILEWLEKNCQQRLTSSLGDLEQQAAESLEKCQTRLDVTATHMVVETEKQLAAMSRATAESLVRAAQSTTEEFRGALSRSLREFQERSTGELEGYFRTQLQKQFDVAEAILSKQADQLHRQVLTQFKDQAARETDTLIDALQDRLLQAASLLKAGKEAGRTLVGA